MKGRIIYIGGFELPDENAAANRVIGVSKSFREAGYDVELIGVTKNIHDVGKQKQVDGFKYISVKYPNRLWQWLHFSVEFVPLKIIIEREPDAVILYNFTAIAQKRIMKYCHAKGIKVFADLTEYYDIDIHSLRDIVKKWDVKKRMYDYNLQLDGIIAISQYLFNFYKNKVNTVYIPVTVDLQNDKWDRDRQVFLSNPIKLVYAGWTIGTKDKLEELVKCVSYRKEFELNICGITEEQYITFNDKNYIRAKNVIFHGFVAHTIALKMVKDADFSVIIRDDKLWTKAGFPTKFVEALSCGTAVIATPSSNICDYLKDGINGFILDKNQTLSQCLDCILAMPKNELIKIKQAAKNTSNFDYRNFVSELDLFFNKKFIS